MSLLQAHGLCRRFGGLLAVDHADLALQAGEIHALIGPNGAGKTTLVSLLSGRLRPDAGRVLLAGEDITALAAHQRVRRGIAYTFQITSVFRELTVGDNVALAAQRGRAQADAPLRERVAAVLDQVGLQGLEQELAGALSYGHQRLLEVAMGLALAPRLLILDEPTQGLAAGEVSGFQDLLKRLVPALTVLLIEHNMELVMALADRITVLQTGRVLARGTAAEIRANPAVQEAYLGA